MDSESVSLTGCGMTYKEKHYTITNSVTSRMEAMDL